MFSCLASSRRFSYLVWIPSHVTQHLRLHFSHLTPKQKGISFFSLPPRFILRQSLTSDDRPVILSTKTRLVDKNFVEPVGYGPKSQYLRMTCATKGFQRITRKQGRRCPIMHRFLGFYLYLLIWFSSHLLISCTFDIALRI